MMFAGKCKEQIDKKKLWCVKGSACMVREGESIKSPELGKIKKFAFLEEVEKSKKGDRIKVKKVKGWGPEAGWVSPTVNGKAILELVNDVQELGMVQAEQMTAMWADVPGL